MKIANLHSMLNKFIDNTKISVLVIVSMFIVFCHGCSERVEVFYPSFDEIIQKGEVARGWIPEFLPTSSADIFLFHYIDAPVTWCAFKFSNDALENFRDNLGVEIYVLPHDIKQIKHPKLSWWPEFLSNNLDVKEINKHGFSLYVTEEQISRKEIKAVLFAIDWKMCRGFFYRAP